MHHVGEGLDTIRGVCYRQRMNDVIRRWSEIAEAPETGDILWARIADGETLQAIAQAWQIPVGRMVRSSRKAASATCALNTAVCVRRPRRPDAFFFIRNLCCQTDSGPALNPEFPLIPLFRFAEPLLTAVPVHHASGDRPRAAQESCGG